MCFADFNVLKAVASSGWMGDMSVFDNNVYIDGSLKNIVENGEILGYELQTNITYYRGILMSMIARIEIKEDGRDIPKENIRISTDRRTWFTLDEARQAYSYKWEYGEPLYIRVMKPGGLTNGKHQMEMIESVRTAYMPLPMEGERAFEVFI